MTTPSTASLLRRLQVIVWLQWMGATLGLPLLPLFLKNHGAGPSTIGVIMGSFFLSGVVTQFVAGRFADRFGRRTVLIGALLLYGIAGPTYLLPVNANWFIVTRVLQGAAAGAIEVAALSTVAGLVDENERGRAVSKIFAAQLGGIAMGPLFGVLID
ncbi:MAG: MFS transporter, partial [Acidobacteria bacterium]|nr:MFS transporter [Acidobacteriota bacterium]